MPSEIPRHLPFDAIPQYNFGVFCLQNADARRVHEPERGYAGRISLIDENRIERGAVGGAEEVRHVS